MKIELRMIKEQDFDNYYREKIGFVSDDAYEIYINHTCAGIVMVDNTNPYDGRDCLYIEWIELKHEFKGKSIYTKVLSILFDMYHTQVIELECSDKYIPMYMHFGASDNGISALTENHKLALKRIAFEGSGSRRVDSRLCS